jgi:predicted HTH transcriptional regulator
LPDSIKRYNRKQRLIQNLKKWQNWLFIFIYFINILLVRNTQPYYEEITITDYVKIAVITIEEGTTNPYVVRHDGQERIYTRMGKISSPATIEQQARLFGAGGLLYPEVIPVSGTSIASLDMERIKNYLFDIIKDLEVPSTQEQWIERLNRLSLIDQLQREIHHAR